MLVVEAFEPPSLFRSREVRFGGLRKLGEVRRMTKPGFLVVADPLDHVVANRFEKPVATVRCLDQAGVDERGERLERRCGEDGIEGLEVEAADERRQCEKTWRSRGASRS